jgi:hypothetical protein
MAKRWSGATIAQAALKVSPVRLAVSLGHSLKRLRHWDILIEGIFPYEKRYA